MSFTPIYRILIVDDNAAIHEDFQKILGPVAPPTKLASTEAILFDKSTPPVGDRAEFEIDSAYQGEEALEKVTAALAEDRPYAVAFIDIRMPPGWDGVETVLRLWKLYPLLQVVLCTAHSDYSWEQIAARLGVSANLVLLKKPFDNLEVLQLAHALSKKWQMTLAADLQLVTLVERILTRSRALEESNTKLRSSEERFAQAFLHNPIAQAIQNRDDSHFVAVNRAFVQLTGFGRDELLGQAPARLNLAIPSPENQVHSQKPYEVELQTKTGEIRQALISLEPIYLGERPHVLTTVQDITEKIRLQNHLRQAQKMEALGQLATGVAHDFNNLLGIIECHTSLQLARGNLNDELTQCFREIEQSAERAAALTRQLLTFSRRRNLQPQVLQINPVILDLSALLRRVLGEKSELRFQLTDPLPPIFADPTNIEQILMNLVVNARDAMPRGGSLTVATEPLSLCVENAITGANPGAFVCLSVSDTGCGMDPDLCRKIFEPFFTTKSAEQGSGMGLAIVHGIAHQHQGWVDVHSVIGHGSTFRVFFPVSGQKVSVFPPLSAAEIEPTPMAAKPTLLIVEDEEALRILIANILRCDGFDVFEAENCAQAQEIWLQRHQQIDLLLTDLVLPGAVSGIELASSLLAQKPTLKVLYSSGHSPDGAEVDLREGLNYLPKPYLSLTLLSLVHKALGTR